MKSRLIILVVAVFAISLLIGCTDTELQGTSPSPDASTDTGSDTFDSDINTTIDTIPPPIATDTDPTDTDTDSEEKEVTKQEDFTTIIASSDSRWWDRGVQYPRMLVISHSKAGQNGTFLATFEQLSAGLESYRPGYPIYRSTDNGKSWKKVTFVSDNDLTMQSEWNPMLYELSRPCGSFDAGTILLAGCSIDPAHSKSSSIVIYASTDSGASFKKVTTVAYGGGLENGVWEPFLLQLDDGRLVCYYSDDSTGPQSQKIVYKVSDDVINFGKANDVVASGVLNERPGMAVITRLGNGSYFMVYEVVDHRSIGANPIFFRTSQDGLDWGDETDIGTELVSTDQKALGSAPYCAWTPLGSKDGTIVVSGTFMRQGSSMTGSDIFISRDLGKTWTTAEHPIPYDASVSHCGYSNCIIFSSDGTRLYSLKNPVVTGLSGRSEIVFASKEWE